MDSPYVDRLCVPRAFCNNGGRCECLSGYTKSSTGNCGRDLTQACESDEGCIDGLVCKEKQCSCLRSDQYYDDTRKICLSRVDGPCNSTSTCVSNAECKLFSLGFSQEAGHCSCKEGFIKNLEGKL